MISQVAFVNHWVWGENLLCCKIFFAKNKEITPRRGACIPNFSLGSVNGQSNVLAFHDEMVVFSNI